MHWELRTFAAQLPNISSVNFVFTDFFRPLSFDLKLIRNTAKTPETIFETTFQQLMLVVHRFFFPIQSYTLLNHWNYLWFTRKSHSIFFSFWLLYFDLLKCKEAGNQFFNFLLPYREKDLFSKTHKKRVNLWMVWEKNLAKF